MDAIGAYKHVSLDVARAVEMHSHAATVLLKPGAPGAQVNRCVIE
jgi:hypothetical protein